MTEVSVRQRLLADNEAAAAQVRARFDAEGTLVVNLISSPGAGKTTLLEATVARLGQRLRMGAIEGDIATERDAARLRRLGVPAHQILTGGACHLDARMVHHGVHEAVHGPSDVLVFENVGNLVCPAEFDLGEDDAVMLLSVTEGHDKPKKYPLMFRRAGLLVLNKVDLLAMTDFDVEVAVAAARDVHPGIEVIRTSCRTGEGIAEVAAWVEGRIAAKRGRAAPPPPPSPPPPKAG